MYNDYSIAAIIPARGGSKGILRKNLRKIHDKSLLEITIATSKASLYIDKVIVSSEDNEIIQVAKSVGAEVPFVRPDTLACDDTPGIDPILHALNEIEYCDYVMLLQVTSPLRTTADIDNCIEYCISHDAPACVAVVESNKHPYWMFLMDEDNKLKPLFTDKLYPRRQDLPPVYTINGSIYIAQTSWVKRNKTFITDETIAFIMPPERSVDIDSEFDLVVADVLLNNAIKSKSS